MANSWSYFETYDSNVSIKYAMSQYLAGKFMPIRHEVLNAGIPEKYYWIHFNISNEKSAENSLIIDIKNARLNKMELFEAAGDTVRSLGKLGDFYPFSQRLILHKNFIYEASILPGRKKEYFLFVNQVGNTFTLPVKIFTAKKFRSSAFNDYLLDGVTYGILLFVAIVSFLYFLTSRHYLYLYYGLYIITAIGWFLGYFGLGYQYIWGNHPPMNTSMAPFMASINILLNLQICQVLLNLSKTNRFLSQMANVTKCLLIALALFPLFFNLNNYGYRMNHNYLILFLVSVLFAMMIVSFSVVLYSIKGYIAARLYLIASLLKAGSIINLALLELGITPAINNMEQLLQIGIFVEITLLTYALAMRYTNFKARTFVRVIEAQENERSMISKEIHDGISNSLVGINYGIENLTRNIDDLPVEKRVQLEKIFDELNKVQLEARGISHNTMPDYIKESSITEVVEKYVGEMQNKANNNLGGKRFIQINFSANKQLNTFSEAVKLNIFRIIQEILTNILKHSRATNADILFSFSKKEMVIIAEDNGIGFRQESKEGNNGMGVKNIRTRVELLDGSFVVRSPAYKQNPEQVNAVNGAADPIEYGTMIKIKIPYRNNLLKNMTDHEY